MKTFDGRECVPGNLFYDDERSECLCVVEERSPHGTVDRRLVPLPSNQPCASDLWYYYWWLLTWLPFLVMCICVLVLARVLWMRRLHRRRTVPTISHVYGLPPPYNEVNVSKLPAGRHVVVPTETNDKPVEEMAVEQLAPTRNENTAEPQKQAQ